MPKAVIYYGRPFRMDIGVTQGDPVSPTVFNIVVDAVVRVVILEVFVPQEAQNGLVWSAWDHNIIFYTEYVCIAGHNPIWIQKTLEAAVHMLYRVGLKMNLEKSKAMVCTPGLIWGQKVEAVYKWSVTWEGSALRGRNRTRVICEECGSTMEASSLHHHMEISHVRVMT